MPMFRAKTLCFVNNSIRRAGEEFEYNGPVNTNLENLDGSDQPKDKAAATDKSTKWTPKAKRAAGADEGDA
jgi:hypothetical protein